MSMTKIATVTVPSGGQAAIEFLSIPQGFTDLYLVISARTNRSAVNSDTYVQFNGVTTATYSFRRLYGSGNSGVGSDALTNQSNGGFIGFLNGNSATGSTFGNLAVYIPNYSATVAKSWSGDSVTENNAGESWQQITAGSWSGTSAITSISVKDYNSATYLQYSSATLYGITKGTLAGVTVS